MRPQSSRFSPSVFFPKTVNRYNEDKFMKRFAFAMFTAVAASVASMSANAGFYPVGPTNITYVENGWFGEGLVVHLGIPAPAGCATGVDDYAIHATDAAYKQMVPMLLGAYFASKQVQVVIDSDTCGFANRAKIVGVRLLGN